jgi:RNA polymerase sigma-B factor
VNIIGELKRYFRDKTWSVRVPRSLQELHMAVNVAREELSHQLAASPTVAQVAAHIGVSEEDVLEAMEAGSSYRVDPLGIGGVDDERTRDLPMTDSSFERVLDRHRLSAALPRLDGRERMILKGLYFDGRTQAGRGRGPRHQPDAGVPLVGPCYHQTPTMRHPYLVSSCCASQRASWTA